MSKREKTRLSEKYSREFHIEPKILNVVIGIYHKTVDEKVTFNVNQQLESLQIKLKQELERYEEIQLAFVYGFSSLDVRAFRKLDKNTPIYYKENGEQNNSYNLANIWLMGLALLEQRQQENLNLANNMENRFYLIKNGKVLLSELQMMFNEKDGKVCINPRFASVDCFVRLIPCNEHDDDILEAYIRKSGRWMPDKL